MDPNIAERSRPVDSSVMQDVHHEVFLVLRKIFDGMYPVVLLLALSALAISLFQTLTGWGSYLFFLLQFLLLSVIIAITFFRRRLSGLFAFSVILGVIYVIALASLINRGVAGSGMIHLIYFTILAGIYLGLRKGLAILSVSAGTLALVGIGVCTGMIAISPDSSTYLYQPVNWILQGACMILYAVPLIMTMKGIQYRMMESTLALRENNQRLESEIAFRRSMEEKLRQSEEKYRSIFEHAVEGIFQVKMGGNLISANPALAQMMGYDSPEEMVEQVTHLEAQAYVHREDRENILRRLQEAGEIKGYEALIYRKDRSVIWVSINGRVVRGQDGEITHYEGSLEDITQRTNAERALVASEANYRNVVESSVAGFFVVQDGFFRFVNRRACEMTGYDACEVIDAMKYAESLHPNDREYVEECVAQFLAGSGDAVPFEARILCKDGKFISARFFVGRTLYRNAEAISGAFIDVSREKILESQLRQAHKMEAIGQLAGGIAHDFNNILTAFNGYGAILQMKMPKDDPLRIYVDHILSAAQKATSLTQNLLSFSRQQPITLAPVDVNRNIRGTEKLLKRLLTEDIAFSLHLTPEDAIILADASQIDRILFNLTANARDAMPQGGHLRLETAVDMLDRRFRETHGFGKPGRYVRISLFDTGIGMDKETVEKIFNPFFTTKEPGEGTGLGLATVYGIVKQHDGYVLVDSKPRQGTAFHLYFPSVDAVAEEEPVLSVAMQGGKEAILVADDNEDVRSFIRDVLSLSGYRIIEAVDGEDAVRKFRDTVQIDLVILDSVMPKMNGRRALDEIQKKRPDVKVLFISGYTRDIVSDKGVQDKGFHFLTKPLYPSVLLDKVREVLDQHRP